MAPFSTTLDLNIAGTWVLEDDGIAGNGISRLRRPGGGSMLVEHPTTVLKFTASEPGVTLVFNLTDSLGATRLVVGDLANSAVSPESIVLGRVESITSMTLVATGSITESAAADTAPDVIAASLIMSAGTGLGSADELLETQVGALEAETNTEGIWIANQGNVVIGGLTASVAGLDVATSGNINFYNKGSIRLSDTSGAQVVHGGSQYGHVRLETEGLGGDIICDVENVAVAAPGGNAILLSSGGISLGSTSPTANNDVLAGDIVWLVAEGSVTLAGDSDVLADAFTDNRPTSVALLNGTGGITILATASVRTSGYGDVFLTSGEDSPMTILGAGSDAVRSTLGGVSITADRMAIGATSGITAAAHREVFIRTWSADQPILLGTNTKPAGALALSGVELNRIFSPKLYIDNAASPVTVVGVVDLANVGHLAIRSGGDIRIENDITVAGSVTLSSGGNVVQKAGTHIGTGAFTALVDQWFANGTGASPQFLGTRSLATPFVLHGGSDGDTLTGNAAPDHLFGNGGNDLIDGGAGSDEMTGGAGDDWFVVRDSGDLVFESAGGGNDRVFAYVDWTLNPGASIETLSPYNQATSEAIDLTGNALAQTLYGNAGNNILDGGGGGDALAGLGGDDWYVVRTGSDQVYESLGGGNDRVFAYASWTLSAGAVVETLSTYNAATSEAFDLIGNDFNQTIYGNAGANRLDGKNGTDTLFGDAGADVYAFTSVLGVDNIDRVFGFQAGVDKIAFAGVTPAQLLAGAFRTGTAAQDADDRIIYNPATGALFYDGDGNGAGAQVQFATLQGAPLISASDFALI